MNENSVEDEASARSPALLRRGSGDKRTPQKLQGKLSGSTKTAGRLRAAHSRRRPVFAKKSPVRLQETVQHLSLSSALDHVMARWRNPCHQLMGILSASLGMLC